MPEQQYSPLVSQLLTYGGVQFRRYPDYLALGFTEEHIPELIRLMQDEFHDYDENDASKVRWAAPVHAWRTLAQLQAETAIPTFFSILYKIDEDVGDVINEEFPELIAMIGTAAIPEAQRFLKNESNGLYARIVAASVLEKIGIARPEQRDTCIAHLTSTLMFYRHNDETFNAFIISSLVDLQSEESLPLIRKVFAADCAELQVQGDIEDVEISLGVRTGRSTPRPKFSSLFDDFIDETTPYTASPKISRNAKCPCGSGKKYKKCCLHQ